MYGASRALSTGANVSISQDIEVPHSLISFAHITLF